MVKIDNLNICQGEYMCKHCHKMFTTYYLLHEHCKLDHKSEKTLYVRSTERKYKILSGVYSPEEESFQCSDCGKTFVSQTAYIAHRRQHVKKQVKFVCIICYKTFLQEQELVEHQKLHHRWPKNKLLQVFDSTSYTDSLKELTQKSDKEIFAEKTFLSMDQKAEYGYVKFLHDRYDKNFKSLPGLKFHAKVAHDDKHYNCESCGKVFTHIAALINHIQQNKGTCKSSDQTSLLEQLKSPNEKTSFASLDKITKATKKFGCNSCDKMFRRKAALHMHQKTNHENIKFSCGQCDKTFKSVTGLTLHVANVHEGKRHNCETCGKIFTQYSTLIQHRKVQHSNEGYVRPQFLCKVCGKKFESYAGLNWHIRSYHEGFRYLCELCGRSFCNSGSLSSHLESQHNENYKSNRHLCEFCHKTFLSKGGLRFHIRTTHEGSKHLCDTCGKAVSSLTILKQHMRVHTGERPYACELCMKKFATRQSLRVHLRVHTKEKPNVCKICGKRYSQRCTLTLHIRAAHVKEKPYKCTICPKRFVMKTLLNTHLKLHLKKSV